MSYRPNRTLLVGSGPTGEEISRQVAARHGARGDHRMPLATAAATDDDATLVQALLALARLRGGPPGAAPNRSPLRAVDLFVVAQLDEVTPHQLETLAGSTTRLVSSRLQAATRCTWFLLLPDPVTSQEGEPLTPAQWLERVATLPGERGFLLDALNADGLALDSPGTRIACAAEALGQLVTSPLGRAAEAAHPAGWASLGVAVLRYPGARLRSARAARLAREMATRWLARVDEPDETHAAAFLAEGGWTMQSVGQQLLPPSLLGQIGLEKPLPLDLAWHGWAGFRQAVELAMTARLAELTRQRGQLATEIEALVARFGSELAAHVQRRITAGTNARPGVAQLGSALEREAHLVAQTTEGMREALARLEMEWEEVGARLERLAALLPATGRAWWRLFWRPHQWLGRWRAWRAWRRTRAIYLTVAARRLALMIGLLRADLMDGFFEGALGQVRGWSARLTALEEAMRQAEHALAERAAQLAVNDDELGQGWRWDVGAPNSAADQLTGVGAGWDADDTPTLAAWGQDTPAPESVAEILLAAARGRLGEGDESGVLDALAQVAPHPVERQACLRALLAAATPFWQEDELVARAPLCFVGVPVASAAEAERLFEREEPAPRVIPLDDRQQIVALQVRLIDEATMAAERV